ncbi:hypothetical protein BDR22DRAFT_886379 [Usnea florida]
MNHEGPSLPRVSPLGMTGIVIFAFVLAIDALALGVRLRSRSLQGLSLCFNDYAVLLAWPPTAVSFVLDVLVTIRGADGQHLVDVSPTEVTFFLKTVPIGGLLWITANTLIKLSILHFYKTVFGINGVFRYTTYVVAAVVVSFGIGVFLQEFLLCRPFAKNWNRSLPGVCGSSPATIVAEAMTRRRKIVFTVLVGLGSIICVITILRIDFAVHFNNDDSTYDFDEVLISTGLEPLLGILVACLPMFPPVFKGCVGRESVEQDSEMMRLRNTTTRPRFPDGASPVTETFPDSMTHTLLQTERRGQEREDRFTGSDSRASFHRHWI